MAVNFTTIKNTNQETIIHFEAAATITTGTVTIANLTAGTQARNSDAPKVNIVRIIATGEDGATLQIQRNNKTIFVCAPENAPVLDLPSFGISDGTYNDYDIVVNNQTAKQVSGYITLRKIQGWDTKVEDATYGAYDDPTRVGASTTKSGSPDKA
jgi:hypothetical protein